MLIRQKSSRRGAAMIMMIVCIIGLFGLLALGIEIGVVAIARSQAQNAADASAMAGARTINGNSTDNFGLGTAPGNAVKAAHVNSILGVIITGDSANVTSTGADTFASGQVSLVLGTYGYNYNDTNPSQEGFQVVMPRAATSTEPYSAVRSTIAGSANVNFARVFGISSRSVQATAVAVHRPRDVFIIMDLSGSMRFQSLPGIPYYGSRTTSMNPDPDYPKFGHYSDTSGAALFGNTSSPTGGGEYFDPANVTYTTNSGPPIVEDFYANAAGVAPSSSNRAFTRGASSKATAPGGDDYLKTSLNTGANYAHTMNEFNNSSNTTNTSFEVSGYAYKTTTFNGYTEGPGYWGKTFFVWPPNPGFANPPASVASGAFPMPTSLTDTTYKWHTWGDTNPRDWRQRFFVAVNTSASPDTPGVIQHNTILFDSSGNMKLPGTSTTVTENGSSVDYTYRINYAAILHWLQQSPVHFPSTVQAGRIRYYTAIPDGTDTALNNRFWATVPNSLANNEKFWKEYIDFVFGFYASQTTANSYTYRIPGYIGNGDFYTWSGSSVSVNERSRVPSDPHRNPITPYNTGTTAPHLTSVTGAYMTSNATNGQTSGAKSIGATSIPLRGTGLPTNPVANSSYVTFNNNLTKVYKLTTNSRTTLTLATALTSNVADNSSVQVYSSNNVTGAFTVSVNTPTPTTTAPTTSDWVTFNNDTTNKYDITTATSKTIGYEFILGPVLANGIALQNESVQIYASNGVTGATRMSVTLNGSTAPVANRDYVIFNNDKTKPYLITARTQIGTGNTYILTIPALTADVNINGATVDIYSPFMTYGDDVKRPKHHFWFGPQTWVDWLGNYNTDKFWWPGNVHEAQAWACKVGIQTAIDDIRNNHPNDLIGMTFYSSPMYSRTDTVGYHNRAIVALGRNYQQLKDSLWFPPSTVTGTATEITPYDADMRNVPRANGSTAPSMGFMIAYNQLSNSVNNLRLYATPTTTYRGNAGGLGRKGSNVVIIFETDGAPNTDANSTIVSSGSDSYYPIRVKDPSDYSSVSNTEWPVETDTSFTVSDATTRVGNIVQQICALNTAGTPGFSTSRQSALVYPIGYGSLFDPNNSSTQQTNALTFMQTVAYHGKTATNTTGSSFPDMYRIYGTNTQRIDRMQKAFSAIMQSGTQVSLIE
jgi:Flp pilus assembly protein TadG